MSTIEFIRLSRRERQIMDIVYKLGEASAADIQERLPDELTNSGVRTLLRVLEKKEYLTHKTEGVKFVFYPTVEREKAQFSALRHLKETFFSNSPERVMAALMKSEKLTKEDLDKFEKLLNEARKEGD